MPNYLGVYFVVIFACVCIIKCNYRARYQCSIDSFKSGKYKLLVCGFAFVFVKRFAELTVQRIHVSAQPGRGYSVLNILFHACDVNIEFARKQRISRIFQRKNISAVESVLHKPSEQRVSFQIRLESES